MSLNLTKNFEPSIETRRKQLFTFKYSDTIGAFPQPGLIQTSNTTAILFWTTLAIILSGVGLFLMKKYAGVSSALLYFSILVDIVVAGFSHWNQDKICILTNQHLVVEENQKGNSLGNISKYVKTRKFGHIAIWALAAFQIYFMVRGVTFLGIPYKISHLIIVLCFIFSAYLHTKFTGFAWGYLFYKYSLNKDIKEHIRSGCITNSFNPNKPKRFVLQTAEIKLKNCEYGGHEIKKEDELFVLLTRGILEDYAVKKLADGQDTQEQKFVLARESLKDQLEILNSEAQIR